MNMATIAALENRIRSARGAERLRLQPELRTAMTQLRDAGVRVPARLRDLNEALVQEEIEAKFDNLPL